MKTKYIISSILIIFVLFGLSVFAWLKPESDMSLSERRPLEKFPELSFSTLLSGDFSSKFESYATDQFPLRDTFRTFKAISKFYLFNQKDNNDIYIHDGYAAKIQNEVSDASLSNAISKITYLYENLIKDKTDKVYLSIIPDKNTYLADAGNYPSLDYSVITDKVRNELGFDYIDIFPLLDYTDYYKTDSHWSQDKVTDVADALLLGMGKEATPKFEKITLDKDFFGVYYGQSSLPLPPDKISYLMSDDIENAIVYNYETNKETGVYNMSKLDSKDPYEMFLSGAVSLMKITNTNNPSGEKLIVFRDSFTSSLAPLLLHAYSEIYLIDTRYIFPQYINAFIGEEVFEGADVLFLYSAPILNESFSLK